MARARSCGPLAVVDGATVVGVVTVDDIQQWLSRRPRRTSLTNKAEDPPVGDQGPFQRPTAAAESHRQPLPAVQMHRARGRGDPMMKFVRGPSSLSVRPAGAVPVRARISLTVPAGVIRQGATGRAAR
jgi:hypothetical protein